MQVPSIQPRMFHRACSWDLCQGHQPQDGGCSSSPLSWGNRPSALPASRDPKAILAGCLQNPHVSLRACRVWGSIPVTTAVIHYTILCSKCPFRDPRVPAALGMADRYTPRLCLSIREPTSQWPSREHQVHRTMAMTQEFSDNTHLAQSPGSPTRRVVYRPRGPKILAQPGQHPWNTGR